MGTAAIVLDACIVFKVVENGVGVEPEFFAYQKSGQKPDIKQMPLVGLHKSILGRSPGRLFHPAQQNHRFRSMTSP
jgi:hypothetical protein